VSCRTRIEALEDEKNSLELSIKAGQVQKEIYYDETDKIQNVQQQEIGKLKNMLLFREQVGRIQFNLKLLLRVSPTFLFLQESLDQQNRSKQDQDQIQSLKSEIARIKSIEQSFEEVKVSWFLYIPENTQKFSFFFWRISCFKVKKKKNCLVAFSLLIISLRLN
jgi:hypothetical protein